MAASTGSISVSKYDVEGSLRKVLLKLDLTGAGTNGYSIAPSAVGLSKIVLVRVVGQESNSYAFRYIADSAAGNYVGPGKLYALSAVAVVATGDVGVVWLEVLGF